MALVTSKALLQRARREGYAVGAFNANNLEMIQARLAEAYREYLREPYKNQFIGAEPEAKAKKIGIWSQEGYERPSEFRRRKRERGK